MGFLRNVFTGYWRRIFAPPEVNEVIKAVEDLLDDVGAMDARDAIEPTIKNEILAMQSTFAVGVRLSHNAKSPAYLVTIAAANQELATGRHHTKHGTLSPCACELLLVIDAAADRLRSTDTFEKAWAESLLEETKQALAIGATKATP